jgi:hypothetical protein
MSITSKREWKRIYKKTWYAAVKWRRRRFPREQTRKKKQKIIIRKYVYISTDSVASFTDVARSKEWLRHEKKRTWLTFFFLKDVKHTNSLEREKWFNQPKIKWYIFFFLLRRQIGSNQNGWWSFISRNCVVLYHEINDFWCGIFIYYTIFKSVNNMYNIYGHGINGRIKKKHIWPFSSCSLLSA